MDKVNKEITPEILKGIEFLYHYLGNEGRSLLKKVAPKNDEIVSFEFPLPEDYLGIARTLRIGFCKNFPVSGLQLQILPSAWLEWPHVMPNFVCLYGFGEQSSGTSAELVIRDNMQRLSKLVQLILPESDVNNRNKEFFREITPYWQMQLKKNKQQLTLLMQPTESCELFVLTDQREATNREKQIVWLAGNILDLEQHLTKLLNRKQKVIAPANAGFYIRLKSHPGVKIPSQESIITWLSDHISEQDKLLLTAWFVKSSNYPKRWLLIEVPDTNPPVIQSIVLRHKGVKEDSYYIYGRRAARRIINVDQSGSQLSSLEYCPVHLLSKSTIHSRDTELVNEDFSSKKVAIIGAGSLGSAVIMQLVRAGIENLTLIDPDKFESANLGRHVLGIDDLGQNKTDALKERIQKDIPFTNIKSIPKRIQDILIEKIDLLKDIDVVVITSANWFSEDFILFFRELTKQKWALIQGWAEPHAIVGHVLVTPSNSNDNASYMFDHNGNFNYKFTEWPDNGQIALPGCGHGFIPGGPIGISQIANLMAQTTIDVLIGKITEKVWLSSIGDLEKVQLAQGTYTGPTLPHGCKQIVISQQWPSEENLNG